MNETKNSQFSEFVFRRLSEGVKLPGGAELPSYWWLILLGTILAFAIFYVVWMYRKDSRGIGAYWATVLGFLRLSVYAIIAFVFLLPAIQTGEDQTLTPRVIFLYDVSGSMLTTKDDLPDGVRWKSWSEVPSRQDKVFQALSKNDFQMISSLTRNTTVTAYRFGAGLDDAFYYFDQKGKAYTRDEIEAARKKGTEEVKATEPTRTLWDEPVVRWGVFVALTILLGLICFSPAWAYRAEPRGTWFAVGGATVVLAFVVGVLLFWPTTKKSVTLATQNEEVAGLGMPAEIWSTWLRPLPESGKEKEPIGLNALQMERLESLRKYNKECALAGMFSGTNVPNALLTAVDREKNNLIQGIVVITDGKSTTQSSDAIETIVERAKSNRIPIFTVGVGADRPTVRIDITNVRLPRTVRPDDSFKGVVEVVGLGLPDAEQDVYVDVAHVEITRKRVQVLKDGKPVPVLIDGKEVLRDGKPVFEERDDVVEKLLDLQLMESDEKKADSAKKVLNLTPGEDKKLTIGPIKSKFDRSPVPKLDAEFNIDAKMLAELAGKKDDATFTSIKRWELEATRTDPAGQVYSELRFMARTPRNKGEMIDDKITEHVAKPVSVAVVKKKLNVLVFTSSASREYQFLRSMFQREVDKERAEFSIYLQNPPGKPERRDGVLQDIDQDRFLNFLPYRRNQEASVEELAYWMPAAKKRLDRLKKRWKEQAAPGEAEPQFPSEEALAKQIAGYYDLGSYDVVIALDPDWGRISEEPRAEDAISKEGGGKLTVPDLAARLKGIQEWSDNGGGLVVVGGAVNTIELARPRKSGANENVFKPIQELYPVILQDIRVRELDNKAEWPYPLNLDQASPEMDFLRLKDVGESSGSFLADWTEFFGKSKDKDNPSGIDRGFYWYYPSERVRAGALVVARYNHTGAVMKDGTQQPFIVVSDPASGRRVVWLASAEFWRLRTHSEAFHERFWTKLARYAAAGSQAKSNKRITLVMSPTFKANAYAEIEAKIETLDGRPMKIDPKLELKDLPTVLVTVPQGLPGEAAVKPVKLLPKPNAEGWYSGKFLVRYPGPGYRLELSVPRTGDTDSRGFDVEESNPEKDDTRPDFPVLYQLASEASEVLDRIKDDQVRKKIELALSRPRPIKPGEDKTDAPAEKLKLFFDLNSAHLISQCMTMEPVQQRIKGPVRDQWDDGFVLYQPAPPGQPVKLSYVLILVVGLLSAEWLIRKLLRLA